MYVFMIHSFGVYNSRHAFALKYFPYLDNPKESNIRTKKGTQCDRDLVTLDTQD